jgi:hypothetical protein
MSRDALPTFDVRQQYYYLVYHQLVASEYGTWTLMGQLKSLEPNQSSDTTEFKRVGDPLSTKRSSAVGTDVTMTLYYDDTMDELAAVLGQRKPVSGWVGNEKIQLDTTKYSNFKIVGFDGTAAASNIVSNEYLIRFTGPGGQACVKDPVIRNG